MINLFFDSSALIAGIISDQGAARVLLLLAEDKKIQITVSEQVIAEVERNIARKAPKALPFTRELLLQANLRILPDPSIEDLQTHHGWIHHQIDLPILVSAVHAHIDFLVTHNSRHFIDDPMVSQRSGLTIGSPGDALIYVRKRLERKDINDI